MNRMFRSLCSFALSLTLLCSLGCVSLAAQPETADDTPYMGYLVCLDATAAASLAAENSAQLLSNDVVEEFESLLPLVEDQGIYKTGDLDSIRSLVYSGCVAFAEPDYQAELLEVSSADYLVTTSPNDPYFKQSYQYNLLGDHSIQVQSAWEAGLSGEGVTVAVIDTGLNYDHVDVPVNLVRGRSFYYRETANGPYAFKVNGVTKRYDYYSSSSQSVMVDDHRHGTLVTGIIAANTNNSASVSGIAPNATIIPIKCFTKETGKLGGMVSNLISGINFAVNSGADIINMSWGVREYSAALDQVITSAANSGCILVAAAGNDGNASVQYPADFDNVISVGATDRQGHLADFSQRRTTVDLCAPGVTIYGPSATNSTFTASSSGTSFSAPTVAAAIALLKEGDPTMTQADFLARIQNACDPITSDDDGNTDIGDCVGAGNLNLKKLLDKTGHSGIIRSVESDGVILQGSIHLPKDEGSSSPKVMLLLCGYNARGHLLESTAKTLSEGAFGGYRFAAKLSNPNVVTLRAFFLKADGTLQALAAPAECSLLSQ